MAYVNTGAFAKALNHCLCTSANAARVLNHVAHEYPGRRILFPPDKYLGTVMLANTQLDADLVDLYDGACHVHAKIGKAVVENALARHPDAEALVHPECACSSEMRKGVAPFKDGHFISSEQILHYATMSAARKFIVAIEKGLISRLRKKYANKNPYPVSDAAVCEYMKMNPLEKPCNSLKYDRFEVRIDQEVGKRARIAVTRMPPNR